MLIEMGSYGKSSGIFLQVHDTFVAASFAFVGVAVQYEGLGCLVIF